MYKKYIIDINEPPPKSRGDSNFDIDRNNKYMIPNRSDRKLSPSSNLVFLSDLSPSWINDIGGKSLQFNNNNYPLVADSDSSMDVISFNTTSQRFVLYILAFFESSQFGYIICKNYSSSATMQYGLLFNETTNNISVILNGGTRVTTSTLLLNKWYFVVVEWNSSVVRTWINGVADSQASYSSTTLISRPYVLIGARSGAEDRSTYGAYFLGKIARCGMCYGNVTGGDVNAWAKRIKLYERWKIK